MTVLSVLIIRRLLRSTLFPYTTLFRSRGRLRSVAVGDAETAPHVQAPDVVAVLPQPQHQGPHLHRGLREGLQRSDLGTDVAGDPHCPDSGERSREPVRPDHALGGYTELAGGQGSG